MGHTSKCYIDILKSLSRWLEWRKTWLFSITVYHLWGFPAGTVVKNSTANAGDVSSIPGSGRSPGEGNGNPLQYSCLENSMDRGAWQATVLGVAKSWTWLSTQYSHNRTFKFLLTSACYIEYSLKYSSLCLCQNYEPRVGISICTSAGVWAHFIKKVKLHV